MTIINMGPGPSVLKSGNNEAGYYGKVTIPGLTPKIFAEQHLGIPDTLFEYSGDKNTDMEFHKYIYNYRICYTPVDKFIKGIGLLLDFIDSRGILFGNKPLKINNIDFRVRGINLHTDNTVYHESPHDYEIINYPSEFKNVFMEYNLTDKIINKMDEYVLTRTIRATNITSSSDKGRIFAPFLNRTNGISIGSVSDDLTIASIIFQPVLELSYNNKIGNPIESGVTTTAVYGKSTHSYLGNTNSVINVNYKSLIEALGLSEYSPKIIDGNLNDKVELEQFSFNGRYLEIAKRTVLFEYVAGTKNTFYKKLNNSGIFDEGKVVTINGKLYRVRIANGRNTIRFNGDRPNAYEDMASRGSEWTDLFLNYGINNTLIFNKNSNYGEFVNASNYSMSYNIYHTFKKRVAIGPEFDPSKYELSSPSSINNISLRFVIEPVALELQSTPNSAPILTLDIKSPVRLYEGSILTIEGSTIDTDIGDSIIIKGALSSEFNISAYINDGRIYKFKKELRYSKGSLYDGNSILFGNLVNGEHTLNIFAVDSANNKSNIEPIKLITSRNRPPVINIDEYPTLSNGLVPSDELSIKLTVSDPDFDPVSCSVKFNSLDKGTLESTEVLENNVTKYEYKFKVNDLDKSRNIITFKATDNYNDISEKSIAINTNNTVVESPIKTTRYHLQPEGLKASSIVAWVKYLKNVDRPNLKVSYNPTNDEYLDMDRTDSVSVTGMPESEYTLTYGDSYDFTRLELTNVQNATIIMGGIDTDEG